MRDSKGTTAGEDDETTAVSEAGEALSGTSKSRFVCAAADGTKAVYLTGTDLYEFYPDGEGGGDARDRRRRGRGRRLLAGRRARSTSPPASEEPGGEPTEPNSEEELPVAGEPNLYLYQAAATPGEAGTYAFIGTLAGADANPLVAGPLAPEPVKRLSRVTPSGGALAFMSRAAPDRLRRRPTPRRGSRHGALPL